RAVDDRPDALFLLSTSIDRFECTTEAAPGEVAPMLHADFHHVMAHAAATAHRARCTNAGERKHGHSAGNDPARATPAAVRGRIADTGFLPVLFHNEAPNCCGPMPRWSQVRNKLFLPLQVIVKKCEAA